MNTENPQPEQGDQQPTKPQPTKFQIFAVWSALISLALLATIFILSAFVDPDFSTMGTAQITEEIKDIHGGIEDVRLSKTENGLYDLEIFFVEKRGFDDGDVLFCAGNDFMEIFKKIIKYNGSDRFNNILVFLKAPSIDNLGREGTALLMKIHYDIAILSQINWANMTGWSMLNLALIKETKPIGRHAIISFCSDKQNRRYADRFCSLYSY